MKLGEMLVRDGRIEQHDLDRVMEMQDQGGGRLGSLLVAERLIDAEALTVYLGLELGIPIATGATFERCKRSAVRLLSPEQAAAFRCIPIVIQGQTLIVAVDNPHDMQNLDQISQATGYRVIPRVAPEIRICFYLERFYGVPQPPRFAQLPGLRGETAPAQGLPAPPLPGLPPRVEAPKTAPTPPPPLEVGPSIHDTEQMEAVMPLEADEHEALELDAADLVEELEADDEDIADTRPVKDELLAGTPTPPPSSMGESPPAALSSKEAIDIIDSTVKRGDIADAILGHAAAIFDLSVLMLVRDNIAYGWKGFGPGIDTDRIETLLIPLEATSMFRIALSNEGVYRARAYPSTLHQHWFRVLRSPIPDTSILVACFIGKRVVNMLYGHTESGEDLSDEAMDGLQAVMKASSRAYVRLISKSKAARRAETMNPGLGMAEVAEEPSDD